MLFRERKRKWQPIRHCRCVWRPRNPNRLRAHNCTSATFSAYPRLLRKFYCTSEAARLKRMQATASLIVGYSWVDGHLQVINSPGVGWPIAWKRFVLVVIGKMLLSRDISRIRSNCSQDLLLLQS